MQYAIYAVTVEGDEGDMFAFEVEANDIGIHITHYLETHLNNILYFRLEMHEENK